MAEPGLDFSEIIELYKDDARKAISAMVQAVQRWDEIAQGGPARTLIRRFSHQLRGSGTTYGFHNVTFLSKAVENTVLRLEKGRLRPEERVRQSMLKKINRLSAIFPGALEKGHHEQPA